MRLVKVVVDIPLNREFLYLPGKFENKISPGMRVLVPFRNQKKIGWVVGFSEEKEGEYKEILKVYDKEVLLTPELLELSKKISDYYFSSYGEALSAISKNLSLKTIHVEEKEIKERKYYKTEIPESLISSIMKESFTKVFIRFKKEEVKEKVYFDILASIKDGSAILLFPQIYRAQKYYEKFKKYFGENIIFFHGSLSKKEKTALWLRMLKGKNLIVIGTRISVFSPLRDLKLIIIDEGSNFSYKEKQTPKYDTFKVAEWRAKDRGIPLVIGENIFSVGEYYMVKERKIPVFEFPREKVIHPPIQIFHLRKEKMDNRLPFFTRETAFLFEQTLLKKGKIGILHNRKGIPEFIMCEICNYKFLCDKCNGLLIILNNKKVMCKLCNTEFPFPEKCPQCGSRKIIQKTYGLEKIKTTIQQNYPSLKLVKKMDEDGEIGEFNVLLAAKSIERIIEEVEFSLLIFVNGDMFFNFPDYKAEEDFFLFVNKIISKVKNEDCKIIIQTPNPYLTIYKSLKENKPEIFYEKEISIRRFLLYPPFTNIIKIEIEGKKVERLEEKARKIEEYLKREKIFVAYSGFSYPPLKKGKYIYKFLIKTERIEDVREEMEKLKEDFSVSIDVNPERI
ncbi:MAG: primosomal protein N' [Candidatus Omnitrophota bacterium]|nr:MAG: primosomal protein N' [Candidatus Omnitrophota bacterium]